MAKENWWYAWLGSGKSDINSDVWIKTDEEFSFWIWHLTCCDTSSSCYKHEHRRREDSSTPWPWPCDDMAAIVPKEGTKCQGWATWTILAAPWGAKVMINAAAAAHDPAVDNNNRAHQLLFHHPEDIIISIITIHPQPLHLHLHLLDRMHYVNWQPIELLRQ